jgi:hypothetical protein
LFIYPMKLQIPQILNHLSAKHCFHLDLIAPSSMNPTSDHEITFLSHPTKHCTSLFVCATIFLTVQVSRNHWIKTSAKGPILVKNRLSLPIPRLSLHYSCVVGLRTTILTSRDDNGAQHFWSCNYVRRKSWFLISLVQSPRGETTARSVIDYHHTEHNDDRLCLKVFGPHDMSCTRLVFRPDFGLIGIRYQKRWDRFHIWVSFRNSACSDTMTRHNAFLMRTASLHCQRLFLILDNHHDRPLDIRMMGKTKWYDVSSQILVKHYISFLLLHCSHQTQPIWSLHRLFERCSICEDVILILRGQSSIANTRRDSTTTWSRDRIAPKTSVWTLMRLRENHSVAFPVMHALVWHVRTGQMTIVHWLWSFPRQSQCKILFPSGLCTSSTGGQNTMTKEVVNASVTALFQLHKDLFRGKCRHLHRKNHKGNGEEIAVRDERDWSGIHHDGWLTLFHSSQRCSIDQSQSVFALWTTFTRFHSSLLSKSHLLAGLIAITRIASLTAFSPLCVFVFWASFRFPSNRHFLPTTNHSTGFFVAYKNP